MKRISRSLTKTKKELNASGFSLLSKQNEIKDELQTQLYKEFGNKSLELMLLKTKNLKELLRADMLIQIKDIKKKIKELLEMFENKKD